MTPPGTPHAFKTHDAASYDPVVESFDRLATRFCSPFAERMVELSQARQAQRVLDVGTGTGLVALRAANRVGPHGTTVGIDLSEGMLRTARAKGNRAGLDHLAFQKMDAEALAFADCSFDIVLSLFALTHFPAPLVALHEMHRVVRPGGRVVIGVGGPPPMLSWNGLGACVGRLKREVLQWRGKQLTAPQFLDGLAMKHLADTTQQPDETQWAGRKWTRADVASRLVKRAGFRDVRREWREAHALLQTPEEFWEIQTTWSSIARKRLLGATPRQIAVVKDEFWRSCDRVQSRGGRLVYPLAAFYISATRR